MYVAFAGGWMIAYTEARLLDLAQDAVSAAGLGDRTRLLDQRERFVTAALSGGDVMWASPTRFAATPGRNPSSRRSRTDSSIRWRAGDADEAARVVRRLREELGPHRSARFLPPPQREQAYVAVQALAAATTPGRRSARSR